MSFLCKPTMEAEYDCMHASNEVARAAELIGVFDSCELVKEEE